MMRNLLLGLLTFFITQNIYANAVGTDFQLFNPTHSATHFVSVESSKTSRQAHLKFGLYLHYSHNLLPEFKSDSSSFEFSEDDKDSSVLGYDLTISLGLTDWADLGVSIPFVASQSSKDGDGNFALQYADKGLNELRTNLKVRLLGDASWGLALVGGVIFDFIDNNPFTGDDPGPTFIGQLAFDYQLTELLRLGINVGYKFRQNGDYIPTIATAGGGTSDNPLLPFGNDFLTSLGLAYKLESINSSIIAEFYMRQAISDPDSDDFNTSNNYSVTKSKAESLAKEIQKSAEALLGFKYFLNENLQFHAGVVAKVIDSPGVADFRVYGGLNYIMGPLWGTKKSMPPVEEKDTRTVEIAMPAPAVIPIPEIAEPKADTFVLKNVLFRSGSGSLALKGSVAHLTKFKNWLDSKPSWQKIIVQGHTDSNGGEASNQRLSEKRAKTIRTVLIKRYDIDPNKIEVVGYGEAQPVASNETNAGRKRNRRVEIQVVD